MRSAILALVFLVPLFASAEPMRNANVYPVNMRGGPGVEFAVLDRLEPGELAERGRCDLRGLWCLMSTDRKVGWVNTSALLAPDGQTLPSVGGPSTGDPLGVSPVPINPVFVEPLPPPVQTQPRASVGTGITRYEPVPGVETPGDLSPVRPSPDTIDPVRPLADVASRIVPGAGVPLIFATNAPFNNVTRGLVNLRAGPGTDNEIIGQLRPGEGGYLDICEPGQRWCRIMAPEVGLAWVKMTLMGTRRF